MTRRSARSEPERNPGPSFAGLVTDMLGRVALTHRPDRARIMGRLGNSLRGPVPTPRHRRLGAVPSWSVPAVAVTLGVALALIIGPPAPPTLVVDPPTGPAAAPTQDPAGAAGTVPADPAPASRVPSTGPPTLGLPPADPTPEPPLGPPAPAPGRVEVVGTSAGTRVELSGSAQDWVTPGVRSSNRTVRAANPRVRLDVNLRTGDLEQPGPFRVSFTGGAPQDSRADADVWRTITPSDGRARVIVPALAERATLAIWAGAVDATAVLTVDGAERTTLRGGPDGLAARFTVTIPAGTAPTTVLLVGEDAGPGGHLGLAAIELR